MGLSIVKRNNFHFSGVLWDSLIGLIDFFGVSVGLYNRSFLLLLCSVGFSIVKRKFCHFCGVLLDSIIGLVDFCRVLWDSITGHFDYCGVLWDSALYKEILAASMGFCGTQ